LPVSSHVTICVFGTTAIIFNGDGLDEHLVFGGGVEDSLSASPLAGACCSWVRSVQAADPVAHLNPHWGLWVAAAAVGERIGVLEGADGVVVNGPDDALGGPVDGICVPALDGG